jgi:glycosyltransferase involved in cell wall biosynthesis
MEALNTQKYSILIPTWNNLECLKLCINSIKKYSVFEHQILVFINEANQTTTNWLKESGIEYIASETNVGICYAMNELASLAINDFLVYVNDDMVALPGWDIAFHQAICSYKNDLFFLSSTLIEPKPTNNPNLPLVVANYGYSPDSFDEIGLIENINKYKKADWNGASWPVSLISKRLWHVVGGYSIEFSPGMYSDPDFSMKLWKYGIRNFRGVGDCLFYHFGSKSTKRIRHNAGSAVFLLKWNISAKAFYTLFLKMGTQWIGELPEAK